MFRQVLINALYGEIRLVVINNNKQIKEFYQQNKKEKSRKTNIYIGRVQKIIPSLQAIFVNYGNKKKGFLPIEMIHPKYYRTLKKEKEILLRNGLNIEKNINNRKSFMMNNHQVEDVIEKEQTLLIQIEKEDKQKKGAFLSTYISLYGRYCIIYPNSQERGMLISKRIRNDKEKTRLKKIYNDIITIYSDISILFISSSQNKKKVRIVEDILYLIKIWKNIKKRILFSSIPKLVYEENNILANIIKHCYKDRVKDIIISGIRTYAKVYEFFKTFIPKNITKIQNYSNNISIFYKYNLETQLKNFYFNMIKLKSGGNIVINVTEAMTCIDINSGINQEEKNIEKTAIKTNIEAAYEISRQIKLRSLSGLIVIDFIDMKSIKNRKLIEKNINKEFINDKLKVKIGTISKFGLLEMSRQRDRKNLYESSMKICTECCGVGMTFISSSLSINLIEKLMFLFSRRNRKNITVDIKNVFFIDLIKNFSKNMNFLELFYQKKIKLIINQETPLQKYILS